MKKILSVFLLVFGLIFLLTNALFASNGSKPIGEGAINKSMGGAGVAFPQDTNAMVLNPAGLIDVGTRIDLQIDTYLPRAELDTSEAPLGNAAGRHRSTKPILAPGLGFSYRLKNYPVVVGIGAFSSNAVEIRYEKSRLSPVFTNNDWDKDAMLKVLRITPTVAWSPHRMVDVGLAGCLNVSWFESDLSTAAITQTQGQNRRNYAVGAGFMVGGIFKPHERVRFGVSYESRQRFTKFKKYLDTVPRLDGPQQLRFGIAVKPTRKLLIAADMRWIDWDGISLLERMPVDGGFGWRDQWISMIGLEYELTEKLKVRAGFNHGRSPIRKHVSYANALFPLIIENHATAGFSYRISEHFETSFCYEAGFRNRQTDPGTGDVHSRNGKDTRISLETHAIYAQLSILF